MVARFVRVGVALLVITAGLVASELPGVGRTFGYVPDAAAAIKIAVTVWEPLYGKQQIASERPFHATLAGGVWHVRGSLPPLVAGGVAETEIRRRDGKVLTIIH